MIFCIHTFLSALLTCFVDICMSVEKTADVTNVTA